MAKRILLVEDNPSLSKALESKLTQAGYILGLAHDGLEAQEKLQAEQFDLIITDVVMPKQDGLQLLQQLKAQGNQLPIIVLSNVSRNEERLLTKELGVIKYFVKVETALSELVAFIQNYFGL